MPPHPFTLGCKKDSVSETCVILGVIDMGEIYKPKNDE
jgi:hypothetical protein